MTRQPGMRLDAAPQRDPSPRPGRGAEIRALTGLRAVAAVWVVLYHFQEQLWPITDQVGFLRPVINAGWTGVELFFTLSGFVIARAYLEECGARWDTRTAVQFVVNRFARVWPAYAVVTVVSFSLMLGAQEIGVPTDVVSPHPPADWAHLAEQLAMVQMWAGDSLVAASFVNPGWSISVEWLAYLCFPVLALVLYRLRRLHPVVTAVLAVLATAPLVVPAFQEGPRDTEVHWVLRIACCFVAGALVSMAVRRLEGRPRSDSWGLFLTVTALAGILLVCWWNAWRRTGDPLADHAGVVAACYPLLVMGLALSDRGPARVLSCGALLYGGRISYCLYLVHFPVREVAVTLVRPAEPPHAVTPGLTLAVPLLILLSGLLAAALHHGVEEPARRRLLQLWRRVPGVRAAGGARRAPEAGSTVPTAGAVPAPRPRPVPGLAAEPVAVGRQALPSLVAHPVAAGHRRPGPVPAHPHASPRVRT